MVSKSRYPSRTSNGPSASDQPRLHGQAAFLHGPELFPDFGGDDYFGGQFTTWSPGPSSQPLPLFTLSKKHCHTTSAVREVASHRGAMKPSPHVASMPH